MKTKISISNFLCALCLSVSITAIADTPKPKYGSEATLLSASHQYIRSAEAPDYWAISPYYVSQQDDKACSLAVASMVINAAKSGKKLTADDELATQAGILKRVKSDLWTNAVGPN